MSRARGNRHRNTGILPVFLLALVAGLAGVAIFLHRHPPGPLDLAGGSERTGDPSRGAPRETSPRSLPAGPERTNAEPPAGGPGYPEDELADLASREPAAPRDAGGREPTTFEVSTIGPAPAGGIAGDPDDSPGPELREEPFDPLVDPLLGLPDDPGADAGEVETGEEKELPRLPTAQATRLFTLSLEGTLGGVKLPENDPHTWARMAYFLQQEARSRFYLVYPGGFVPIVRKVRADGQIEEYAPAKGAQPPAGASPVFRLSLRVEAGPGQDIRLFGETLASKYNCNITCRLEGRQGDTFQLLQEIPVSASINPARGAKRSPEEYTQLIYHAALDKLAEKLETLPIFRSGVSR